MAGPLNAKVILARCSQSRKSFGIRIEQRGNNWIMTWAFPVDEHKALREGYSANSAVTMSGEKDANFPGCPCCRSDSIVLCECGKIGCQGGVKQKASSLSYPCPWCNKELPVYAAQSLNVSGGGY